MIEEFQLISQNPNYVPSKDLEILLAHKIIKSCEGSLNLDTKRSYTVIELILPTKRFRESGLNRRDYKKVNSFFDKNLKEFLNFENNGTIEKIDT